MRSIPTADAAGRIHRYRGPALQATEGGAGLDASPWAYVAHHHVADEVPVDGKPANPRGSAAAGWRVENRVHGNGAAVFRSAEPLTIEAVEIDQPRGREVLVRTVATGVCHSDLHVVDGLGRFPLDRPYVLGHEGAGVVEAVGADVTTLAPGDHVVACLSGFCGSCAQCLGGHPNLCTGGLVTRPESVPARLSQNGAPVRQFLGISSYAERMLLHENSVVKIDSDLPLDRAALVGCGVLTGFGAALRTSGLERATAAVFGCGGVGLSIIQGTRIGGARHIIGVTYRLQTGAGAAHGATHVVTAPMTIRSRPCAH